MDKEQGCTLQLCLIGRVGAQEFGYFQILRRRISKSEGTSFPIKCYQELSIKGVANSKILSPKNRGLNA